MLLVTERNAVDEKRLHDAYRLIATHLYGNLGRFAYMAFDFINERCFDNQVPETLIIWDITEHGRRFGWCRSSDDGPPIIKLHPSMVNPKSEHCWGDDVAKCLGRCFAFDVLLHEMMHAHINYNLGGNDGAIKAIHGPTASRSLWTCHNCPNWVNECCRIARLIGVSDNIQMTYAKRIDGKLQRVNDGVICPSKFPIPLRCDFYRHRVLPWE